jgi:hypothetical protein
MNGVPMNEETNRTYKIGFAEGLRCAERLVYVQCRKSEHPKDSNMALCPSCAEASRKIRGKYLSELRVMKHTASALRETDSAT